MSLVNCNKVYVTKCDKGLGVFAKNTIHAGELIESGFVRRVDIDGNNNPYLFTWSEDRTIWAFGSGCSTFYNTSLNPNTKMIRYFDEDRFEIIALKNINKDEELTHKYKSLNWRTAFSDLCNKLKI
jgi:hypothetical protein